MNHGWRLNLIAPPPNWGNRAPRTEAKMADALTHLYGAIDAIKFVADGAGIAPVEIRLANERDGRKLIAVLNACDSTRMLLASPIDGKGHEFTINDVKITWPQ